MDETDGIERRFPILFSPEKGFDAPILVKTLTEAARAIQGTMETVVEDGILGGELTERVAQRRSGEFRIAVFFSSIRIRRRIGDRWNVVSIEIGGDGDPDAPIGADEIARADTIIREIAGAAWRHQMLGMTPEIDPIIALHERIEEDAPTVAAVLAATGAPVPVKMDFGMPSQLVLGDAVGDVSGANIGVLITDPRSISLPSSLVEEWWGSIEPFLHVTRADPNVPGPARSWSVERFYFTVPINIDPVTTLRLIGGMPDRLRPHLDPLLKR